MTEETEITYLEPSNVADFFLKHVEAMKPCTNQKLGKSFGIPLDSYSVDLLRDIADDSYCVGKKAFVVIDHGRDGFEVQRLPDGTNVKLFYKYLRATVKKGNELVIKTTSVVSEVKRICEAYSISDYEEALKYDKALSMDLHFARLVPYSYIQRRVASLTTIQKAGGSKAIQKAIGELVDSGELELIDKDVAKDLYNRTAKLYKINF